MYGDYLERHQVPARSEGAGERGRTRIDATGILEEKDRAATVLDQLPGRGRPASIEVVPQRVDMLQPRPARWSASLADPNRRPVQPRIIGPTKAHTNVQSIIRASVDI